MVRWKSFSRTTQKMPLNKFHSGAFELGRPTPGSNDIWLMGTKALLDTPSLMPETYQDGDTHHFTDIVGENNRCFYVIEHMVDNEARTIELGVGLVLQDDTHAFLRRESALMYGSRGSLNPIDPNDMRFAPFDNDGYLKVTSVFPPSYRAALGIPDSVLTSTKPFHPAPVAMEENTLLGRKEDRIESISMDDEILRSAFVDALMTTQRQLRLKARHLNLDRKDASVSAPILQATPVYNDSTKPPGQRGRIIYNLDRNCLEFFDGTEWKTLRMEDSP